LFAALVLAETSDDLKFWSVFKSFAVFAVANNLESFSSFKAAFAFLLNLFFLSPLFIPFFGF